jgi:hypothetical protein
MSFGHCTMHIRNTVHLKSTSQLCTTIVPALPPHLSPASLIATQHSFSSSSECDMSWQGGRRVQGGRRSPDLLCPLHLRLFSRAKRQEANQSLNVCQPSSVTPCLRMTSSLQYPFKVRQSDASTKDLSQASWVKQVIAISPVPNCTRTSGRIAAHLPMTQDLSLL